MKKLPSFTIIELVITMLIASVITGICYYVFFLMNTRFISFHNSSQEIATYQLFHKALQKDINDAKEIITTGDGELVFTWPDHTPVSYQFTDSVIIRNRVSATDSFKLNAVIDSVKYLSDTIPLVTSLQMQLTIEKERVPVLFTKEYTSEELIKYYTLLHE